MAVANQTPYKEYIGNGTTKIFPLEFDCDDADHLIVKVNDIEVPALNNWSLNTNTGSVVFAIAPISQSKLFFSGIHRFYEVLIIRLTITHYARSQ